MRKIRAVMQQLTANGISKARPFPIGRIDKVVLDYAERNGIALASKNVYISVKGITHTLRPTKVRDGVAVSKTAIIMFPQNMRKMAIYYDGSFIYTDGKNKFVISPNYKVKLPSGKTYKTSFVTARKIESTDEFNDTNKYTKIR